MVEASDFASCLALPQAWGGQLGRARLKLVPHDFHVQEQLGFTPDGGGEHVFLHLEKTGLTTLDVVRVIATLCGKQRRDIGYAGLKDKHAVTKQWFSVALPPALEPDWSALAVAPLIAAQTGRALRVVEVSRHARKLRIGAHLGNRFELRLAQLNADNENLLRRCEQLQRGGFPNYFGLQRFGLGGANLSNAQRWFRARSRVSKHQRSLFLSAARSGIFNAILAQRVTDNSWCTPLAGDVFQLNRSGSLFTADSNTTEGELNSRLASLDIHVTAPLWGVGESLAGVDVAAQELAVASSYPSLLAGLEAAKLAMRRRALRASVDNFSWDIEADNLLLAFDLFRGSYATVLVNELLETA